MTDADEKDSNFRITDRRGQEKEEPSKTESKLGMNPEPKREAKPEPKAPAPPPPGRENAHEPMQLDFPNFILSLSTSALIHMGAVEEPEGQPMPKNLPLAKQEIAIIEMLAGKTKGNLTPQEARLMEEVLYELRLRFVEASRQ
jgi:hypothetical protein